MSGGREGLDVSLRVGIGSPTGDSTKWMYNTQVSYRCAHKFVGTQFAHSFKSTHTYIHMYIDPHTFTHLWVSTGKCIHSMYVRTHVCFCVCSLFNDFVGS